MKNTGPYPRVHVDTAPNAAVGQTGGILLTEAIRAAGLDRALSEVLTPWRKPVAIHDPGKVVSDVAIALALGGDALADIGILRSEPGIYGQVASDATVSRTITALAADADQAMTAISQARAAAPGNSPTRTRTRTRTHHDRRRSDDHRSRRDPDRRAL